MKKNRSKGIEKLAEFAKKDIAEVLTILESSIDGITNQEAKRRLEIFGANEIVHEKPPPWYVELLKAFVNPFIGILIFLAVASYITDVLFAPPGEGDWSTIIIICIMVGVSGVLRFVQEYKSKTEAQKLKAMIRTTALVRRKDVGTIEINIDEVVPGDIVYLSAGDLVPGDLRIIRSKDLFVNQAVLTGESEPVEKYAELPEDKKLSKRLSLTDLENMCFMGTSVVSGSGVGIVVATGENTYLGSVAESLMGQRALTSFEKGINEVSKLLIKFIALVFPIVFVINGLTKGNWFDALLFALAVAVGITPEMLPMIVTANLARGAVAMARRKTIVKRLDSIQNFGAMDVLCTDKTGTLTLNKVILVKHMDVHGNEDERVLRHAFLNSYYQTGLRNLLDIAILEYGKERGMDESILERVYRKVDEIPFDFTRRRMSVVLESGVAGSKKRQLITKGAVEEVVSVCSFVEYRGRVIPLTEEIKAEVFRMVEKLNEDGMRVLAVAQKNDVSPEGVFGVKDENHMVLMGFLAFLDPPKETAPYAIHALKTHGVEIKILTGDNPVVTKKICKEVGIEVKGVLLGEQIDSMTDEELMVVVDSTTIFAKLAPTQKARIIKVLRRKGHVVGFLGDGINDAPAMREADVAISVDNAVDIAKESADIILLEKNLMVLKDGVVEGRKTFANIVKYIAITASSNFGNVFSVLIASAFLPFLPMTPLQLLFLNLTYDLSMTSMPFDRVDRDYVEKPKKWNAEKIKHFMLWFGPASSIFDIFTYLMLFFLVGPAVLGGSYYSLPAELKTQFASLFQTGWFVESLWTQTMVVYMLRTKRIPFLGSFPGLPLFFLTMTALLVDTFVPFTVFGEKLGMRALPPFYFLLILVPAIVGYLTLAHFLKGKFLKRYGDLF
ncbi:magnesium-translocating P-type ATPase [Hydrogenobacter thermophilus TK-6]|uniref:magnesium-translocating P-type ATPase n=1 Tax=Hydrogenobacter thermophilus TaxID=940 RepID=UPI0001E6559F|nr:magnesium-translocating P-type ATPase [Hydrogenobacter thermophilus]ADO45074.1 magnesium-translocating P-type ATPase [Hydrogenobacter thermophilus TK-6]